MTIRGTLLPPVAEGLTMDEGGWARLHDLPASVELTHSRTTRTTVITLPGGGSVVRKERTYPRAADRLRGAFRTTFGASSPAEREFRALERLRNLAGGPFAPRPLGWLDRRDAGVLTACTLLLEELPGARDLATWLRSETDPAARRRVLDDLARSLGRMHGAGLLDRDLHPRNLLVTAEGTTLKIDCPKQRARGATLPLDLAAADLGALDAGLMVLATPAERARMLLCYVRCSGSGQGRQRPDRAGLRRLRDRVVRTRARHERREAARLAATPPQTSFPPAGDA